MAKILSLNILLKELAPLRSKKKIGLVTGCFDVLHVGHIEFLKHVKERVDILVGGRRSFKLFSPETRWVRKKLVYV